MRGYSRATRPAQPRRFKATSPLVSLEASMRLSSLLRLHPLDVLQAVESVLEFGLNILFIEPADGKAPVLAFARYGKGRGTKAQLISPRA